MFNSYGWIQLGINQKNIDSLDEEEEMKYYELNKELNNKVKSRLQDIMDTNEVIRFDFIDNLNNLESFLSIQLSRNHFNNTLRELYKWISEISDGSHGVLYELNDEDKNLNDDRPYRIWKLIGSEFEQCEESIMNEKYYKVNY